ncbi:hypothetical protein ACIO3O_36800 [Streptomyces sp. NPDC087440]|uniref:hypothetical protein n=1 Tax=Streptomyces sp. NPDC087440 TaxID=3365790 RepID=UPI00380EF575
MRRENPEEYGSAPPDFDAFYEQEYAEWKSLHCPAEVEDPAHMDETSADDLTPVEDMVARWRNMLEARDPAPQRSREELRARYERIMSELSEEYSGPPVSIPGEETVPDFPSSASETSWPTERIHLEFKSLNGGAVGNGMGGHVLNAFRVHSLRLFDEQRGTPSARRQEDRGVDVAAVEGGTRHHVVQAKQHRSATDSECADRVARRMAQAWTVRRAHWEAAEPHEPLPSLREREPAGSMAQPGRLLVLWELSDLRRHIFSGPTEHEKWLSEKADQERREREAFVQELLESYEQSRRGEAVRGARWVPGLVALLVQQSQVTSSPHEAPVVEAWLLSVPREATAFGPEGLRRFWESTLRDQLRDAIDHRRT